MPAENSNVPKSNGEEDSVVNWWGNKFENGEEKDDEGKVAREDIWEVATVDSDWTVGWRDVWEEAEEFRAGKWQQVRRRDRKREQRGMLCWSFCILVCGVESIRFIRFKRSIETELPAESSGSSSPEKKLTVAIRLTETRRFHRRGSAESSERWLTVMYCLT